MQGDLLRDFRNFGNILNRILSAEFSSQISWENKEITGPWRVFKMEEAFWELEFFLFEDF